MENLNIKLGKRIDTTNFLEVEKDLFDQIAVTPHKTLTLDAEDLDYIASSGLRVLLKIAKIDKTLRIINTDFISREDFAKKLTGMSLSNLQRFTETFIRLYFGVEDEAEILRYKKMMAQLYMIRGVFSIGFNSPSTIKSRPMILQMARERFFPNIESIINTIKYLVEKS